MAGCIAYAGQGFSDGVLHMLAASPHAAYCLPVADQADATPETKELDHLLAVHFGWWDVLIEHKPPVVVGEVRQPHAPRGRTARLAARQRQFR